MNRISLAFFSIAPVYVLIGMVWGSYMGATGDHAMKAVHAHLNLLGFALNGLMGAAYALTGDRAAGKLAWANFWTFNLGVAGMIPNLYLMTAYTGDEDRKYPILVACTALTIVGALLFAINVWRLWGKKAAGQILGD